MSSRETCGEEECPKGEMVEESALPVAVNELATSSSAEIQESQRSVEETSTSQRLHEEEVRQYAERV